MEATVGLRIHLLGRFSIEWGEERVDGLEAAKVQELFSYLLVHRERSHPRSVLASLLWGEYPQAHAQKDLRQSLWQLQVALGRGGLLVIEPEWVRVCVTPDVLLDVAVIESAFQAAHGVPGEGLSAG